MLTSVADYEYVDWESPILNDADSPGGDIMPVVSAHPLRNEDFCYIYEAERQLYYGGWNDGYYVGQYSITPSISGQYALRNYFGYLSGDWVRKYTNHWSMKGLLTKMNSLSSSDWIKCGPSNDLGTAIYGAISNYVPDSQIVDCSVLDVQLGDKIDDELMQRMYGVLGQVRIVNVPASTERIDPNSAAVPALGLWNFTGTRHYQNYDEDGQLTSDSQSAVEISSGYAWNTIGAPIRGLDTSDYLCWKDYHWQTTTL